MIPQFRNYLILMCPIVIFGQSDLKGSTICCVSALLALTIPLHFVVRASTDLNDIPKPSIPEFTVQFVNKTIDRPKN